MAEKKQYRVKPGFRHGAGGKHGPGTLVELTEAEAAGFLDKLELVQDETEAPEINVSKSALAWVESNAPDLDLSKLEGTGKDGQITLADVKVAVEKAD